MVEAFFQIAGLAASVAIGLVFLLAGFDKWRHRRLLPGVIANYRLLPAQLVAPAAAVLPVVEIMVGAGLLFGAAWAAAAGIGLLLVFAAAMAINIRRGRSFIDCGCGRAGLRQPLGWGLVARNLGFVLALVPRLVPAPGLAAADELIAAVAGLTGFLLVQMFQAINALPAGRHGHSRG